MPRFRRPFLALCLILLAATAAVWVRTHLALDLVSRSGRGGRYYEVTTLPGQVRFTVADGWPGEAPLRWYAGEPPAGMQVLGRQVIYGTWYGPFAVTDGRRGVPAGNGG